MSSTCWNRISLSSWDIIITNQVEAESMDMVAKGFKQEENKTIYSSCLRGEFLFGGVMSLKSHVQKALLGEVFCLSHETR